MILKVKITKTGKTVPFHSAEEGVRCSEGTPADGRAGFHHGQLGGEYTDPHVKKGALFSSSPSMNNHGAHKSEILFCQSLDVMAAGSIFHGRVDFVFRRKRRRTRTWPQMATTSPESSLLVNAVDMRKCIFQ